MQKYIGHNGYSMMDNTSFYFSNYFDWIMCQDTIIKKNEIPNTIYIKIDYLNNYVNEILKIQNDFILISGCSDYSPQVNFKESYLKIINMPNLKKWYAENNLSDNPKMFSLTVGFATHTKEYEENILLIGKNINIKNKINKIFCCWRQRSGNCCGEEFVERGNMVNFIHNYPDIFDIYGDSLSLIEFQNKLSNYKWSLCPLGNGVDCAPKIIECFFLKTIPIVRKTKNVVNLYKNYPVIWVDEFTDVLQMELAYDENIDWDNIINSFTCEHWYKKIIE
jgi:hypothetical protein